MQRIIYKSTRTVLPSLGKPVSSSPSEDFQERKSGPVAVLKPRPDINLRTGKPANQMELSSSSFSISEVKALLGRTFRAEASPHSLIQAGARGTAINYRILLNEILLQIRWEDGSTDLYTKGEMWKLAKA